MSSVDMANWEDQKTLTRDERHDDMKRHMLKRCFILLHFSNVASLLLHDYILSFYSTPYSSFNLETSAMS